MDEPALISVFSSCSSIWSLLLMWTNYKKKKKKTGSICTTVNQILYLLYRDSRYLYGDSPWRFLIRSLNSLKWHQFNRKKQQLYGKLLLDALASTTSSKDASFCPCVLSLCSRLVYTSLIYKLNSVLWNIHIEQVLHESTCWHTATHHLWLPRGT